MWEVVIEIPENYTGCGGVSRMIRLVMELPRWAKCSGGIAHTKELADELECHLRIQRGPVEGLDLPYTIGLPDSTFPRCEWAITYSDNPHIKEFMELKQVKNKAIMMLSYGMCLARETPNVLTPGLKVMCSTTKIKKAIEADGGKAENVGFGFDSSVWYPEEVERQKYALVMYHSSPDKNYQLAVDVAEKLVIKGLVKGIVTFGKSDGWSGAKKPRHHKAHYPDADVATLRKVYSESGIFIMPSKTEGLNLTPIEATLCGCPSIICDGAWDDVYYSGLNCFRADPTFDDVYRQCEGLLQGYNYHQPIFFDFMKEQMKQHTWEKTAEKVIKCLSV